jgi:hypothetical protein
MAVSGTGLTFSVPRARDPAFVFHNLGHHWGCDPQQEREAGLQTRIAPPLRP